MVGRIRWLCLFLFVVFSAACASAPSTPPPSSSGTALSKSVPPEAEVLWRKAEQERKAGNQKAAVSTLEGLAQAYPKNIIAPQSLQKLGQIHLESGQGERALQYTEYLLYTYPSWEGSRSAQVDQLKGWWMTGRKKQVFKEAVPLWEGSSGDPKTQLELANFMAGIYAGQGERETAFEWLMAGFTAARTPEEQKPLTQSTVGLLKDAGEGEVRRLYKKNVTEIMRVFLDYRLIQIEAQSMPKEAARERYRSLLNQNPSHPLVPEIQAAMLGVSPAEKTAPVNANKVGCLVPLNGPHEKYGRMVLRGVEMALAEWNENRAGQPVTLVAKDAPNDATQALKSFESLIREDAVLGIIGPLGSQTTKAVVPVSEKLGVPLLTLSQKDEDVPSSPYALHVFLDNRELVQAVTRYCREKLKVTRFAALFPDDRYGQKLSRIFAEVVKDEGGSLLASVSYKEKTTDFKEPIEKLLSVAKQNTPPTGEDATPFEALFIPDQVQTVSLIAPQLLYHNVVGPTLMGTNLWGEAPLVEVGGTYVEHAVFATPFYVDADTPRLRRFKEKYEALYSSPPSYLEAQAYDAMMLFLQARSMVKGQSVDRVSLLQSLRQIRNFEGVAGTYSVTPTGGVTRNYMVLQVSNGQLVKVAP
jgi:ABC-type branched-subunit amino acid transport system substrate-binding protein